MPEETKCPKCGAIEVATHPVLIEFKCGSDTAFRQSESRWDFHQSKKCEISTLRDALSKAVEALKPFAGIAKQINSSIKDDSELFYHHSFGYSSVYVNMGDVRRASAALSTLTRAENGDL